MKINENEQLLLGIRGGVGGVPVGLAAGIEVRIP